MEKLDYFYNRIPKQKELSASQLIPYFIYFLQEEKDEVRASDIGNCYKTLSLKQYSNISRYLSTNSTGKNAMLIKGKCGYKLHRHIKEQIANELSDIIEVPITENLIPITIFDNTPYYIVADNFRDLWGQVVGGRDLIAGCNVKKMIHAAVGMSEQKYVAMEKRFESKIPLIEKYGYDRKLLVLYIMTPII